MAVFGMDGRLGGFNGFGNAFGAGIGNNLNGLGSNGIDPYILAELHSRANFNQLATQGFQAAFGANPFTGQAPAGPIQNIINQIASQLAGGGAGTRELAALFPATELNTMYFGPPNIPITPTNFGLTGPFQSVGTSNPNAMAATAAFPFLPGANTPNFGSATPQYMGMAMGALYRNVAPTVWRNGFISMFG